MTIHLSTGFKSLDIFAGGLNGGELVLIGGRPGMGKTSFALNLALNMANGLKGKERSAVAFFSMEQSLSQLKERFLSSITRIPSMKIIKGNFPRTSFSELPKLPKIWKRCRFISTIRRLYRPPTCASVAGE